MQFSRNSLWCCVWVKSRSTWEILWTLQAVVWFYVLPVRWPEDNVPSTHESSPKESLAGGQTWGGSASEIGLDRGEDIMSLREQIALLWVVIQRTQQTTSSNPQPLENVRNGNRNRNNMRGEGNIGNNNGRYNHNGITCFFYVRDGGIGLMSVWATL